MRCIFWGNLPASRQRDTAISSNGVVISELIGLVKEWHEKKKSLK